MNRIAIALALVATASAAAAQGPSVVYTNVVGGQRVDRIVRAERAHQPAAPVPPSITDTPVLPRNYKAPLGPTGYVPPVRAAAAPPRVRERRQPPAPWYVNGIYAGPSPSGNWMSTSIGRPIIDVRIISPSRTHSSRENRR